MVPEKQLQGDVRILESIEGHADELGALISEDYEEWLKERAPWCSAIGGVSIVADHNPGEVEQKGTNELIDEDANVHTLWLTVCQDASILLLNIVVWANKGNTQTWLIKEFCNFGSWRIGSSSLLWKLNLLNQQ